MLDLGLWNTTFNNSNSLKIILNSYLNNIWVFLKANNKILDLLDIYI